MIPSRTLTSTVMVRSGDWVIIGGLNLWSDTTEQHGFFDWFTSDNKQLRDTVMFW